MNELNNRQLTEKVAELQNQITLLFCQVELQKAFDNHYKKGIELLTHAKIFNHAYFEKITQEYLNYQAQGLDPDIIKTRLLEAKKHLMISGKKALNEANIQAFYVNLMFSMLKDHSPFVVKEVGGSYLIMSPQSTLTTGKNKSASLYPDLVVGHQVFQSEKYSKNIFSRCPRMIVEFKQNINQKYSEEESFESPSHQMATYLCQCMVDYGHMNPPDYLVGVLIDLNGADVFIINSKMILQDKMESKGLFIVKLQWEFKSMMDSIYKSFEESETDEEDFLKRILKQQAAENINIFHRLIDFMLFLSK